MPAKSLAENRPFRSIVTIVALGLFILAWFWVAGRIDWIQGWAFLLIYLAYVIALYVWFRKADPDLMRERNRPSKVAEAWDRAVVSIYNVLIIILLFLAALDSGRFQWSVVPLSAQIISWLLLFWAGLIIWHVMSTNAYLSSWARIQEDRGQVVVKEGLPMTKTLDWVEVVTAPEIKVPADAWYDWDAKNQKWITVGEKFPEGATALSKTTVSYPSDLWKIKWHDGSPMSAGDFVASRTMLLLK